MTRRARGYAPGQAEAVALVLSAPLSFWGGIEAATGRVIDHSHPDRGVCVSGRVLVMPGGRGSSSASSVLAETIRLGTGPVAIVLAMPDPILTVGALVADALYAKRCPIVVCETRDLATGDRVRVQAGDDGTASIERMRG